MRVITGPPDPNQLQSDIAAGYGCGVARAGRGGAQHHASPAALAGAGFRAPPLTASVSGSGVTFAGSGAAGVNVGLVIDGVRYVAPLGPGDTAASTAAALAALVSADQPASAAGAVLTVPGARSLLARVGLTATARRELRRQGARLSSWRAGRRPWRCATSSRALLDAALMRIAFLDLADGSSARLTYRRSPVDDSAALAGTFRRDLQYRAEWGVFETEPRPHHPVPRRYGGAGIRSRSGRAGREHRHHPTLKEFLQMSDDTTTQSTGSDGPLVVVREPFAGHETGTLLSGDEGAAILASPHASHVVPLRHASID